MATNHKRLVNPDKETCLMEKLDYGFRQHEQRLEERQQQWEKQAAKDSLAFEAFLKDNPDFDVSKYVVPTPVEDSSNNKE